LKYAIEGESFDRLAAEVANPFTASDSTVADYADQYLEYDLHHRVTELTTKGTGCSGDCGGLGTYAYTYSESDNESGYNVWKYKTEEQLPGYATHEAALTVYANAYGQTMLSIFTDKDDNEWCTFTEYDDQGQPVLVASPSAVTGYDEEEADLLNKSGSTYQYLSDSSGLITTIEYYDGTTATSETAGGVEGYFYRRSLKQGETDANRDFQLTVDYIAHTAGGETVYKENSRTVYRSNDGADDVKTTYGYTWVTDSNQVDSVTVTDPSISSGQNGSGTANTSYVFYDDYGRPIWTKDEDGYINYTDYDAATDAVIKVIIDADTSQTGDFNHDVPSGWTTPADGGLHLITTYEVDDRGRTTKVTDPNGNVSYVVYKDVPDDVETGNGTATILREVRTYAGWSSGQTTGPISVWREVVFDESGTSNTSHYTESLTIDVTPAVDGGGNPTGAETFQTADIESLSRSYLNEGGQTTHDDAYYSLSGMTYSLDPDVGSSSSNYLRTKYSYCIRGWLNRTEYPDGTIHRTEYHPIGRVISEWTGTDDTPASGDWSPTNNTDANMVKTVEYEYDDGDVGDGNVTETAVHANASTSYVTEYKYDWRNRLTHSRRPGNVAVLRELDNLGRALTAYTYEDSAADWYKYTADENDETNFIEDTDKIRAKTETAYDEEGQVYKTVFWEVRASDGTLHDKLTTEYWYDARGHLIKTEDPNGLFTKNAYDGAGRVTATYLSFDTSETSNPTYAEADDVSGDTVIEQAQSIYDPGGRVVTSLSFMRLEDDTSTEGELTAANAYATGSVTWYDKADRVTHVADYGRDAGETNKYLFDSDGDLIDTDADGIPNEAENTPREPNQSDDYIAVEIEYDSAGRAYKVTDNKGHITQDTFDLLGRITKTVANYVNGEVTATETDTDQTTQYFYDSSGWLSTLRARNANGESVVDQDTLYLYESEIDRSWVTNVIYPDSSDTDGPYKSVSLIRSGTTATATVTAHGYSIGDTVRVKGADQADYNGWFEIQSADSNTFTYTVSDSATTPATGTITVKKLGDDQAKTTYDRLGRKVTFTDQRGVEHTYTYYATDGRLQHDSITDFGTGVERSVERIACAYTWDGRISLAVSYDDSLNYVARVWNGYNHYGRYADLQDHNTSATWDDAGKIYRFFEDGAIGSTGAEANYIRTDYLRYGPNDAYKRNIYYNYPLSGVGDALSRVDNIAAYATEYAQYSYLGAGTVVEVAHPAVDDGLNLTYGSSGTYGGWDRFGRVIDQTWENDSSTVKDRFRYGYDRASNRTWREVVPTSLKDEYYTYDGLDRLTKAERGNLTGTYPDYTGISGTPAVTQDWTLDALGNWTEFQWDANGDGDYGDPGDLDQDRAHNAANEIDGNSGDPLYGTPNWLDPTYDAAGNMTGGPKPGDEGESGGTEHTYVYDAWNRLVKVTDASDDTLVEYQYDGLHRRICKIVPDDAANPTEWTRTDYYYTFDWQVFEERVDTQSTLTAARTTPSTTVRYQYVWDPRYIDAPICRDSDTSDGSGGDPNGKCTDSDDEHLYYSQDANYHVTALVDGSDGDVVERYMYDPYGRVTFLDADWSLQENGDVDGIASNYANAILYCGYRYDTETGLYHVRHRMYHPTLGRWMTRDPIGYADGMNLYEYVGSGPNGMVDAMGLFFGFPGIPQTHTEQTQFIQESRRQAEQWCREAAAAGAMVDAAEQAKEAVVRPVADAVADVKQAARQTKGGLNLLGDAVEVATPYVKAGLEIAAQEAKKSLAAVAREAADTAWEESEGAYNRALCAYGIVEWHLAGHLEAQARYNAQQSEDLAGLFETLSHGTAGNTAEPISTQFGVCSALAAEFLRKDAEEQRAAIPRYQQNQRRACQQYIIPYCCPDVARKYCERYMR